MNTKNEAAILARRLRSESVQQKVLSVAAATNIGMRLAEVEQALRGMNKNEAKEEVGELAFKPCIACDTPMPRNSSDSPFRICQPCWDAGKRGPAREAAVGHSSVPSDGWVHLGDLKAGTAFVDREGDRWLFLYTDCSQVRCHRFTRASSDLLPKTYPVRRLTVIDLADAPLGEEMAKLIGDIIYHDFQHEDDSNRDRATAQGGIVARQVLAALRDRGSR